MPEVQVKSAGAFLRGHMREYGILFALIAIMAFFQVATGGILLKPVNLTNLILQNSYIIIMAIGMLLVIVAGHIDLSVGSVMGFIGALAAVMIVNWDIPYFLAGLLCLVRGRVDRHGAGLLGRLFPHPVLHRDAGGDAGLQGPDALAAGRSVGRPVPGAVPADRLGLHPRPARRREPQPLLAADRRPRRHHHPAPWRSAIATRRPRPAASRNRSPSSRPRTG